MSLDADETNHVKLELAADLARHQRAVNAVRWSPSGELLASGDDESVIFIWKKKDDNEVMNILGKSTKMSLSTRSSMDSPVPDTANEQDKEVWLIMKTLRGHMEDVYDLSWSPDSLSLVSGSVDNTAMIWNVETGKYTDILRDHKGFVQGVAWDPANKYIATMSTDRYLRVFDSKTRRIVSRSNKSLLPVPETCELHGKMTRLYHDDTLQTFYRRLNFSPDGELIVTPAGTCDQENVTTKPLNFSYIYTRESLKQPVAVLPSPDYTVCIKFCPQLFQLRKFTEDVNSPLIPLPYRMLFAVATKSSVFLYDTQQAMPFGVISNIHYTRLTDIAWSDDGKMLVVSSTDGFCSLVTFADGELGEVYDDKEVKEKLKESQAKPKKTLKKKKKKIVEKKGEGDQKEEEGGQLDLPKIPAVVLQDPDVLSKIIKSDTQFSPQKKARPVTPIAVRRHPRSVDSPGQAMEDGANKPKTPQPIAIRRQPRILIPTEGHGDAPTGVDSQEAVDAWPIGTEKPTTPKTSPPVNVSVEKMLCDGDGTMATSDIRLVLEADSQDEEMEGVEEEKKVEVTDSAKKTPRRVPLRTLSTPKSAKKC